MRCSIDRARLIPMSTKGWKDRQGEQTSTQDPEVRLADGVIARPERPWRSREPYR